MIGLLKNFFTFDYKDAVSSGVDQSHSIHVATCAILLEIARIDGEFSDSEQQNITRIFKDRFHLTTEEISALIEAAEEELGKSIDLWQFTNRINKHYPPEEKIRIMENVWEIVYADGKLDKHEDYLMHKLADLLNLSHKDMIDAKLKALQDKNKD